jgi:hypothetical protein
MNVARFVLLFTLTAPLVASSASPHDLNLLQHTSRTADTSSALVAQVRQVTQPFLDVSQAMAAGYEQFLGCVSGPQEGAMGVHFVNATLVGDGEVDAYYPEALIYEMNNGGAQLVGVEYIVMVDAWHANHADPPVLEGQLFQYNGSPNRYGLPPFYELHVWAWRDNPHGAFVDWNPRVSCEGQ